jgi:hypothetical protein
MFQFDTGTVYTGNDNYFVLQAVGGMYEELFPDLNTRTDDKVKI